MRLPPRWFRRFRRRAEARCDAGCHRADPATGHARRATDPRAERGTALPIAAEYQQFKAEDISRRPEFAQLEQQLRAAREETIKALVAEPFDREKFVAAQEKQSEAEQRTRQAVRDLFAKIATGLTPEERRAFPRWREHRRPAGQNLLDEPDQPAQAKQ